MGGRRSSALRRPSPGASPHRTEVMDDVARAPQVEGGGAKKHRRLPSGRLQRQNSPSGEGWASLNGTASYMDGPMPASGPWMITYPSPVIMTRSFGTTKQSPSPQHHSPAALRWSPRLIQLSWAKVSGMTKARPAKTSANRARLPNIGLRPFRFRCPGPAADQVTHPEDK